MANFINVSGLTYCGKEAQEIFSKDIYDIDLRQYGITFMDGVKGKMKMYTGEIGDAWQLYTCPFTPAGAASLAEAFIEPAAIKVNQENCYDTFWNTFLVDQTEISLRGGIPQTFADWYFAKLRKKMSQEYQEIFWKGDTGYTGTSKTYLKAVDGIEKQFAGNSGVTKVSGATITVDNAIAQVEAVIMKGLEVAGNAEVDTEGYKIFMNHQDVRLLEVALGKVCCPNKESIFSNYARENGRIYVMGYEVIPTMQSKNTIIFGPARNLVLGYDTFDSHIEYKLIDMRDTTGDNMFRVLAISNIAVGIILPELFVVSKP
ncbi:hypothetical protein [uncultured Methanobrevibacter sp.]|uniref:hypothetical protein n=1 Tax=uncultured Methanobrevibacter sp. TaxID=253161 RepID=UPI0025D0986F|nr:hypothetical protein [uncultured Methanobrevibacter sp.]